MSTFRFICNLVFMFLQYRGIFFPFNIIFDSGIIIIRFAPAFMYDQPKAHKKNFSTKFQCCPIMATYNLASYKIAKFIVPLVPVHNQPVHRPKLYGIHSENFIHPQCRSTLYDFFRYWQLIYQYPLPRNDRKGICLKKLFTDQGVSTVFGFTDRLFKTLLEHAVFNSFFLFDDNYYQ